MATFAVDVQGNRIKTDILVVGYVRNITAECNLGIPSDIIGICFAYWFIKVCDEWDKKLMANHVKIDGQQVELTEDEHASIFGCRIIDKGSYSWTIQFKTDIKWIAIGIVEDDPEIMKNMQTHNCFNFMSKGRFILNIGGFFADGNWADISDNYHVQFREKHTIITTTINMDNKSLSFKINDKECGIATNALDKDKYRFMINMYQRNKIVELL